MFNIKLPKVKIFDRKVNLKFENTLIIAPKDSGKTYLILNFLKEFEGSYFYTDFNNYFKEEFQKSDLTIFENYDFSMELPNNPTFITSTKDIEVPNFKKIYLKSLDFEEYFSFNSNISPNVVFSHFLKDGNSPALPFKDEFFKMEYLREKIELMPYNKVILKFLLQNIGQKFSLYQIYETIKKRVKISKDTIYKEIKKIVDDKVIFLVNKWNSPKSPKKIFSYNFGYKNILTKEKNILNILENMVFLELNETEEIYYSEYINFYLPKQKKIVLVMPFAEESQLETRLKHISKKMVYEKIEIITISNEFTMKDKNIEVKPFYLWALGE